MPHLLHIFAIKHFSAGLTEFSVICHNVFQHVPDAHLRKDGKGGTKVVEAQVRQPEAVNLHVTVRRLDQPEQ